MRIIRHVIICTAISIFCASASLALPAFPGAEGFGAETPGGRSGKVIAVTNLNDSGPGSLREACASKGPRIVVFRVGGTITLKKHLQISEPYITIAGQTAPGGGILLTNAGVKVKAHDVIIRCIRVRIGTSKTGAAGTMDGINISGSHSTTPAYNVIVDHCSFSWAIDENADSYARAHDFTFSWCILSEGLANSIHEKGDHSMGILIGGKTTNCSIHHTLLAHNGSRNPRFQSGRRDFVNNIIYDWGGIAAMFSGNPEVNFVSNYYKSGADSNTKKPMIIGTNLGKIFIKDNVYPAEYKSDWELVEPNKGATQMKNRFDYPAVTTLPASELMEKVLPNTGCSVPARDSVDRRIIRQVRNGTGKIIDSPEDVGGFPVIISGEPPIDSDLDGMPDTWETKNGLNPNDPSDAAKDRNKDGYTNVEEYINGLIAF